MTINAAFPIYKVGQRVFQLDNINVDEKFKDSIVNVLDHGGKFIPDLHNNVIDIFCTIVKEYETQTQKLNTKIFFEKCKNKNRIKNKKEDTEILNETDYNQNCHDITIINKNECCNYESIIKKLKTKTTFNDSRFYLDNTTIDFRYKYYNKLSKMKFNIQPNITSQELYFLKKFIREKPFSVLQCDKNVGLSIVSNELLDKLCLEHLSDTKTYRALECNPISSTISNINETLSALRINKEIKLELYNQLITKDSKPGKFRILCKLHKENFGIRPIINNINHPTSKLCKLVDVILQPLVQQTTSYLKDSQHLLQQVHDVQYNVNEIHLYTMDFVSLYTNINKVHAVKLITDYVKSHLETSYITAFAFYVILELIFENNIFSYKNKYYIQVFGLSMGCICGPSIANIFVYILEKKWLCIHKPLVYKRFIDDIFLVSTTKINENDFRQYFLNLNLTITNSKRVNFLDVVITFDAITKKLNTSMYIKPTNTFSYLLTSSNHPSYIFDNIPKSLFIRIRRICDSLIDYQYFSRKLIFQLLTRGYDNKKLVSIAYTVSKIDKANLLNYKSKNNKLMQNKALFFGINYTKSFENNKTLVLSTFNEIKQDVTWLRDYKLKIFNYMSPNLTSIFIHNTRISLGNHTFKCNCDKCETCEYISTNSYIFLKNGFIVPIMSNSNCKTKNVVYIIRCKLCELFYIGETSRCLSKRFNEHLNSIKKFKPYTNKTTEVGYHFNLKRHNYRNDLQLYVFKNKLNLKEFRRAIETDLINLFNHFNPPIINAIIPSNIKHLSFV